MTVTPFDGKSVTVKFTVSYRRIAIVEFGCVWTTKNPQAFIHAGFLDFFGLLRTLHWWRRRESNPRPQILYRQFYILSHVI
jgi:hypothetical protein